MKRMIIATRGTDPDDFSPFHWGDEVTVYESKVGYANYDGVLVDTYVNEHGVKIGVVETEGGYHDVPYSYIVPSQKKYFYSLNIDDVLQKSFINKLVNKDDSIFCKKIPYKRVDRDASMENVVGCEADIISYNDGFRVVITQYISKHYDVTRDIQDERGLSVNDPMIDEALSILKTAPEVIVNFAGYQRTFKR